MKSIRILKVLILLMLLTLLSACTIDLPTIDFPAIDLPDEINIDLNTFSDARGFFGNKIQVEESFEKIIVVDALVRLEVITGLGEVTVRGSSDNEVKINVTINVGAENEEEAKKLLNKILENPPIKVNGNTIILGNLEKYNLSKKNRVGISFDIVTPFETTLVSNAGLGDILIENIKGPVNLNTGLGSITAKDVESDVTINTGSGTVSASNIQGNLLVATGLGTININNAQQNLNIESGSGTININSAIAENVNWVLETGMGTVKLTLPQYTNARLKINTGMGTTNIDFTLNNVKKNNWDLEGDIGENPTSEIRIETGLGTVIVNSK
ncbi:DUF4097 family beta strand repeat protein [bacterium AH-315-K05]|nr:DUF4097 family beta strand repeat protein [bacterium AH-315-K05]MBN4074735.1 DUF4097 family beta strand repeat protein [bacterium AH-315-E09]